MIFTKKSFDEMEKFYRAKFINSLSGVKSANLIGTVNKKNQTNLSIVSSAVHIGANPPLMALIFRPASVERHTFENIKDTQFFSINHVSKDIITSSHQTSARYPREVSEFSAVGLSEEYIEGFRSPFVKESYLKIGLSLKEIIHLNINSTEMVIGEVECVSVDPKYVMNDGHIDISKLGTVGVTGLDSYHKIDAGVRLSYAKPDTSPTKL
tara:strand:+ start:127 stop:756 length:630 start_codon:yes stop_codon:yes gene_type:complete